MDDNSSIALALTYHDPPGRLAGLIAQALPLLTGLFSGIAVQASPAASQHALSLFESAGAVTQRDEPDSRDINLRLGGIRASALRLGLHFASRHILQIDGDRVLHWAVHYPRELAAVVGRISMAHCTVLGRNPRAFAVHPRALKETEAPVNFLFSAAAGLPAPWDVMVGARGFSRQAAEAILTGCADQAISVDVSWPLFLMGQRFSMAYIECDGLEFETGDRALPEIEAAGGYLAWLQQFDLNPANWAHRFRLAQLHCEAIARYKPKK